MCVCGDGGILRECMQLLRSSRRDGGELMRFVEIRGVSWCERVSSFPFVYFFLFSSSFLSKDLLKIFQIF